MSSLTQKVEDLATALVLADVDDPRSLAAICATLQSIGAEATVAAADAATMRIGAAANATAEEMEAVILEEVDDATHALRAANEIVVAIRRVLEGGASPDDLGLGAIPNAAASPTGTSGPEPQEPTDLSKCDHTLVGEFLGEAAEHLESGEQAVLRLEADPADGESLNAAFRSFHTLKGVAGFLGLSEVASLAHCAEGLLDLARQHKLTLRGGLLDLVLESIDRMGALTRAIRDALGTSGVVAPDPALPSLLDRLRSVTDAAANGEEIIAPEPATERRAGGSAERDTPSGRVAETTVKVTTARLDSLINLVGELLIAQSMVRQAASTQAGDDSRVARSLNHTGKITRELQDLSMAMRMVPIQGVFQKMGRLVRDVARKSGKQVEFTTIGGETELDRNIVDAIGDPLVHMIRNSVDHGIEAPADRIASGKPETGRVELRASHQAGNIVIEIRDDGRGLCTERILQKARQAGILAQGQELSEPEIFALIFHAGLSTAEKVTDVSGRGVGMDVVRRNVEALRGRIDITSARGQGSTFTIRLPLTLAMIDGMVVRVGSARYIIPMTSIERTIRPQAEQLTTVQGRGEMCLVRDQLTPLFRLQNLFQISDTSADATERLIVVAHANDRRCGFLVDELVGQQQVVIKSLGESIGPVRGVSGGAILGDGSVCLILDVPGLIALAGATGAARPNGVVESAGRNEAVTASHKEFR